MSDNIGPVSQVLSPLDRSWETVIFIQGRPPLDDEFNLFQDIQTQARREMWLQAVPSGFTNWRSLYAPNNGNVINGQTAIAVTDPSSSFSGSGAGPYTFTLVHHLVVPGTFQLTSASPYTILGTDNGSGQITGTATSTTTTITSGSNGQTLPQANIDVVSTTGFPAAGTIQVQTSLGFQAVTYTSITATAFTGCSGGTGTMLTGNQVALLVTSVTGTINYSAGTGTFSFASNPGSLTLGANYSYYTSDTGNDSLGGDFIYTNTANTFTLGNQQVAVVNGFEIKLYPSNPVGDSIPVTLPAPPTTAGQTRIDLVYLEVWRALVQYPAGSPTNLDSAGNVFQHGGTQFQPAGGYTNFSMPSEIVSSQVGSPTTNRVQVQWAIRTFAGVNLPSYADGLDDPNVLPQGPNATPVSAFSTSQSLPITNTIGTGNNSQVTFASTLSYFPVLTSSVTVTAGSISGTDNGSGVISGTGISGTITYSTGAISVTFTTAPLDSVPVVVTYASSTPGPYSFTLDAVPVIPSSFVLKQNNVQIGIDDGAGHITGGTISSGTINYTTGTITFTLTAGPASNPNFSAAWSASTAFVNQGDNTEQRDAGTWQASNVTGTVDGYVWAAPICAVSRRNTSAWAQATNQNGGSILSSGSSTRPDGLYTDQIAEKDILDLRRSISASGFNWPELMEKNLSWLFDEKLRTNLQTNPLGGSSIGTSWTQIDSIGPSAPAGANYVGAFNGVQSIFGDAAQVTTLGLQVPFASGHDPYRTSVNINVTHINNAYWGTGDTIQIQTPLGSLALFEEVDSTANLVYAGTVPTANALQSTHFSVTGLSTNQITITLLTGFDNDIPLNDRSIGGLPDLPLLFTIYFLFKAGTGLSRNNVLFSEPLVLNGSPPNWHQVSTGTAWPNGVNTTFDTPNPPPTNLLGFNNLSQLYNPSRAATVLAQYEFSSSSPFDTSSSTASIVVLPITVDTTSTFGNPKVYLKSGGYGVGTEYFAGGSIGGPGGNVLTLGTPLPGANTEVLVGFVTQEPIRDSTTQMTFYYESPAFQSMTLPSSGFDMLQLHLSDFIYTAIGGAGSNQQSFPYIRPVNQIPVTLEGWTGASNLQAFGYITVDDFSSISQFMKLVAFIPMASIPEWRFRTLNIDYDGAIYPAPGKYAYTDVSVIPFSDPYNGNPIAYQPNVFSQLLYSSVMHTTVYPTLAVLRTDVPSIGHRGSVFLVVFSRTNNDQQNAVIFTTTPDTSSNAAIYRIKGNPTIRNRGNHHQ